MVNECMVKGGYSGVYGNYLLFYMLAILRAKNSHSIKISPFITKVGLIRKIIISRKIIMSVSKSILPLKFGV